MTAKVAKRTFRFLLPIYFAVFAAMPLSDIHVEGTQDGSGYLCGRDLEKGSLRLLLHELLFTHFNNKSEHLKNTASASLAKNRAERPKNHHQFTAAVETSAFLTLMDRRLLISGYDEQGDSNSLCYSTSGLSPPSA